MKAPIDGPAVAAVGVAAAGVGTAAAGAESSPSTV